MSKRGTRVDSEPTEPVTETQPEPTPTAPAEANPIVLRWVGDGTTYLSDVPARDLTEHALGRLVYVANGRLSPGETGYDDAVRALIERLTASGLYVRE